MPKLIDADKTKTYLQNNSVNHILTDIDAQPTVDATTAKNATVGHWERQRNIQKYQISPYVFVCDQCHTVFDIPTPYCGFCGAKMDNSI